MTKSEDNTVPVPARSHLILSTRDWSDSSEVALAISVATEYEDSLYIERLGNLYRWSLIHRGGPYPLLRITARFLQIDYQRIYVGTREVGDGWSGLNPEDGKRQKPDVWAILTFDGPTTPNEVEVRIRSELAAEA